MLPLFSYLMLTYQFLFLVTVFSFIQPDVIQIHGTVYKFTILSKILLNKTIYTVFKKLIANKIIDQFIFPSYKKCRKQILTHNVILGIDITSGKFL